MIKGDPQGGDRDSVRFNHFTTGRCWSESPASKGTAFECGCIFYSSSLQIFPGCFLLPGEAVSQRGRWSGGHTLYQGARLSALLGRRSAVAALG